MSSRLTEIMRERLQRRRFLRGAAFGSAGLTGLLAASTMGASPALALAGTAVNNASDAQIFNFALNFEYLGSQYYLAALGANPLPASLTGASGGLVLPSGSTAVPFESAATAGFAEQLAVDEYAHVAFIRAALAAAGAAPINQPLIDLSTSWSSLAAAAGLVAPGQTFNPFASEAYFFVGAYVLEDVCITALCGAAGLLTNPTNLAYAASILGVEGYQVGLIRSYLSEIGGNLATNAISSLRATLSNAIAPGGVPDDNGTGAAGNPYNFTNVDDQGQAFRRTPQQVLAIAYGTSTVGAAGGGFFPKGVNGSFTTT